MNDDVARRLGSVGADDGVLLEDDDPAAVDIFALDDALFQLDVGDREVGEERIELGPARWRRARPAVGEWICHDRTIREQPAAGPGL